MWKSNGTSISKVTDAQLTSFTTNISDDFVFKKAESTTVRKPSSSDTLKVRLG